MSEKQSPDIEYDNIIYSINEEENTAGVLCFTINLTNIIIPQSIKHESKEYDVTSILEHAFKQSKIKLIQFASDSKLQKICKGSFCFSTIESIIIPMSVKLIGECAFHSCKQLQLVQFESDSKLLTIEKEAFRYSMIKNITIPSSVTFIGERAFCLCKQLQQIEIPNDSKLQMIDNFAFQQTMIESITIPSELIELKERWCYETKNLTIINVSPKNQRYCCYEDKMIIGKKRIDQPNYDNLVFCIRNIQNLLKIPNFIEHICSFSFQYCNKIKGIQFSNDSKIQSIDEYVFSYSTIENITIPSSVDLIGEGAFYFCDHLHKIEFSNDSKLQTIDTETFFCSAIKSITIPSSVNLIGEGAFYFCKKLQRIEFPNDSKLLTIGDEAFCNSLISSISIPFSVNFIGERSFFSCNQLRIIEINNDNKEMLFMYQTVFKCCQNSLLMIAVDSYSIFMFS